ncbi:androgen-dependent TFPI-regulating protein-like [Manis pentadactyla]|uniref:androgen-dependent TFPI-regulating protein-like n=1 Tax=Manis pentadactyla TaxID=143292 RepID=UPI00255C337E|nr:androgen-dependent TFPI-regulating protein-like [Manis pentadactyla]
MTGTSTCIYHFLVLSWYIFLNYTISLQGVDQRKSEVFLNGGPWKYLTLINLLLQAIFYGVACLEDVLKRIERKKSITFVTAFRDLLFTTLAFPISTFVFVTFWILFLYDRELVFPKALDDVFPKWYHHASHTVILPLSLTEVTLGPHSYPLRKTGLTILTAFSVAYLSRVLWIYSETGTWAYPVFAKLSPAGLAVFFSLSYVLVAGIYLLGEKLNLWKWGDKKQLREKRN